MRKYLTFHCDNALLHGTLDLPEASPPKAGLLIVSGGNEIRSGAHAGQAQMAAALAQAGYAVFRYDRRGVGDSEGENTGFLSSQIDLQAALQCFRQHLPSQSKIAAFGNCDAAAALMLFHDTLTLDALILANPWTIEAEESKDTLPPPEAIRARYWQRLKDPAALKRLLTGGVNLGKLFKGLTRAAKGDSGAPAPFAQRLGDVLAATDIPVTITLAEQDRTAQLFLTEWKGTAFAPCNGRANIRIARCATGSHSFAESSAQQWLKQQLLTCLNAL